MESPFITLGSNHVDTDSYFQMQWDDDYDMQLVMSDDEATYLGQSSQEIGLSKSSTNYESQLSTPDLDVEDTHCAKEDEADIHDEALECLETLVLSFLAQLSDAYSESGTKKGNRKKVVLRIADRRKESSDHQTPMRALVFPKMSRGPSTRPFAQVFRVVDLMHEALLDDVPTTKRDMYYKDSQLFGSQATVDKLVDDVAATFQLCRADLNVRASSKGLICGTSFTVHFKGGDAVAVTDGEASLVPQSEDIERFEVGQDVAWVLVVEKEAVFQTLCRLRFATHEDLPGPGLIVTGKGYPDVATRQLVKTLSDNLPHVPIVALVDGDAYGIDILSVYKYGSIRMRHQNEYLAAARLQWLGLWASELAALCIGKEALLPITKHDEKKARTLLRRTDLPAQCRKELQYMLFTRRKAEIEVLSTATYFNSADRIPNIGLGVVRVADDHPREDGNGGMPLLRYLVAKLCMACADPVQSSM